MMTVKKELSSQLRTGRPGLFKTAHLLLRSESAVRFFSLVFTSVILICIDYFFLKQVSFFRGIDASGRLHQVLSALILLFPVAMAFWYAKNCFATYYLIRDMPSSKIRSAHQGPVELCGKPFLCAENVELLTPYTREPAVWRRAYTTYTEVVGSGNSRHKVTRVVHSLEDNHICAIDDGSGVAYFYPHHAEIKGVKKSVVSRGAYTYVEHWISAREPLYLMGSFKTMGREEFFNEIFAKENKSSWLGNLSLAFGRLKNTSPQLNQRSYFELINDRKFNFLNNWDRRSPFFVSHKDEFLMLSEYRFWGLSFVFLGFGSSFLVLSVMSFA